MSEPQIPTTDRESWRTMIAKYQQSDLSRSIWQIVDSFGPFFLLLVLMYLSLDYSYWLTLLLAVPAAGFQVRTFIIFHDCTHGSFFKSQRANDLIDRKSTRLNSSHSDRSRMPSSA